jgi:hypothetical protein
MGGRIAPGLPEAQYGDRQIYEYEILDTRIASELPQTRHAAPPSMPMTPSSITSIELDSMKARVAELENQLSRTVSSVASVPSITAPSPASTVQITTSLSGAINLLQDNPKSGYPIARGIAHKNRVFGQSHWMNGFVVFRDVIELLEPQMSSTSSMLPGLHRAKRLARDIKASRSPAWPKLPTNDLPPKHVCDKLVEQYLKTIETLYRVLHVPTFQREYEAIWTGETEPQPAFMMQLKLVLAIGAIFHDENCSMRPDATSWIYEAQTWHSSPTFKSKLGIQYLQTSILLLLAREFVDVGSELVWISAGALLREAVYIGLHKDPSRLPGMNMFESEMRRRIWNTILELNLQFSLMSGGPCLLSLEDFNTEPPGNYNDHQIAASNLSPFEDGVLTDTSFAIALRRTLPVRLAVVKFLNDLATSGTYEETLRIDTALRAAYKSLRHTLHAFTSSNTLTEIFAVNAIDFIMNRYISSLHIPYLNPSLHEAMYAFSRKSVFDTSLKIWTLAFFKSFSNETTFARLCRCGAGFFRGYTFHASSFLTVELRTQFQEDEVPRPDLLGIPEEAADLVLRCIEAGETGIKGYLLLRVLMAHIEGIRRRLGKDEMQVLLGRAAEEAIERCVPLLERIAGQESRAEEEVGEFNFDMSPSFLGEFIGDWDLVMSDTFNFGGGGGDLEAFLK